MDADIITKRQLNQAIAKQSNGDDRKLGEILVEAGYVTVEDLTEVMLDEAKEAQSEREKAKRDRLLQKQILQKKIPPKPVVAKVSPLPTTLPVPDEEILKKKIHVVNPNYGGGCDWSYIPIRNVVCTTG